MLSRRICLQISKSIDLKKKEVEDVLGGPDSWKGAPKTDGRGDCSNSACCRFIKMHAESCVCMYVHPVWLVT